MITLCKDLPIKDGLPFNADVKKAVCIFEPRGDLGLEGYELNGEYLAIKNPEGTYTISNMPFDEVLQSFPSNSLRELADLTYWDTATFKKRALTKYFNFINN